MPSKFPWQRHFVQNANDNQQIYWIADTIKHPIISYIVTSLKSFCSLIFYEKAYFHNERLQLDAPLQP